MRGISSVRVAVVRIAIVAIALVTASLVSFPSFSTTGTGLGATPPVSVNRALKGDRLPAAQPAAQQHESGFPFSSTQSQSRVRVPVGCDGAFSPISSPRLANIFRRCMA